MNCLAKYLKYITSGSSEWAQNKKRYKFERAKANFQAPKWGALVEGLWLEGGRPVCRNTSHRLVNLGTAAREVLGRRS